MARNRNQSQNLTANSVYAVIGVGDLAVEKIRDAGTEFQVRSSKIRLEPKKLQADFEAVTRQRVEDVKAAQDKAQDVLNDVLGQAVTTYDDLAGRGKKLVDRIRRQQSTQQAKQSASTTKSQTKAASTTARKNASSTGSAAKRSASNTASTAKKNASQTKSRAQGASTSARKTAGAAGTATQQAAEKVGDGPVPPPNTTAAALTGP